MAGSVSRGHRSGIQLEVDRGMRGPGRTELLSAQKLTYVAFVDLSGGRRDQFTVSVAHRSGDKAVVDMILGWKPPIDPVEVTKECAEVLKPHRIKAITGDAYGGEWPRRAVLETQHPVQHLRA